MLTDVLWTVGVIGVMVAMYWFAYRMEPHWVAKDGSRFLTTAQSLDRLGGTLGRKMEVRATFLENGQLLVARRRLLRSNPAVWRISAKSQDPPRRKQVYLLERVVPTEAGDMLMLRVPASSKVVPKLDAAREASISQGGRGTA